MKNIGNSKKGEDYQNNTIRYSIIKETNLIFINFEFIKEYLERFIIKKL